MHIHIKKLKNSTQFLSGKRKSDFFSGAHWQVWQNSPLLPIPVLNLLAQITMKRRSLLYIVNFLLPVLFFLCLDLASFMISDNGGEKLSFKVTVLLAITVLQLILNEILPSSSNRVPLIGEEIQYRWVWTASVVYFHIKWCVVRSPQPFTALGFSPWWCSASWRRFWSCTWLRKTLKTVNWLQLKARSMNQTKRAKTTFTATTQVRLQV